MGPHLHLVQLMLYSVPKQHCDVPQAHNHTFFFLLCNLTNVIYCLFLMSRNIYGSAPCRCCFLWCVHAVMAGSDWCAVVSSHGNSTCLFSQIPASGEFLSFNPNVSLLKSNRDPSKRHSLFQWRRQCILSATLLTHHLATLPDATH